METQALEKTKKTRKQKVQHDYVIDFKNENSVRFGIVLHLLKKNGIDEIEISKNGMWYNPYYISKQVKKNKDFKKICQSIYGALTKGNRLNFISSHNFFPKTDIKIKTKLLDNKFIKKEVHKLIKEVKENTKNTSIYINNLNISFEWYFSDILRNANRKYDTMSKTIVNDYFDLIIGDDNVDIMLQNTTLIIHPFRLLKINNAFDDDIIEYLNSNNIFFVDKYDDRLKSTINIKGSEGKRLYEIFKSDKELGLTIFNKYLNEQNNGSK